MTSRVLDKAGPSDVTLRLFEEDDLNKQRIAIVKISWSQHLLWEQKISTSIPGRDKPAAFFSQVLFIYK
jgi:hypothetical protein